MAVEERADERHRNATRCRREQKQNRHERRVPCAYAAKAFQQQPRIEHNAQRQNACKAFNHGHQNAWNNRQVHETDHRKKRRTYNERAECDGTKRKIGERGVLNKEDRAVQATQIEEQAQSPRNQTERSGGASESNRTMLQRRSTEGAWRSGTERLMGPQYIEQARDEHGSCARSAQKEVRNRQ